jgi:hypothetical protein
LLLDRVNRVVLVEARTLDECMSSVVESRFEFEVGRVGDSLLLVEFVVLNADLIRLRNADISFQVTSFQVTLRYSEWLSIDI